MLERKGGLNQNFQIIKFSREQPFTSGRKNEDVIFTYEDQYRMVAFLADGATSLSSITSAPGVQLDGYWAANTAVEGISKNLGSPTAKHFLVKANEEIALSASELGVGASELPSEKLPTSSGATVVLIDKVNQKLDISQVGDTISIAVDKAGKAKLIFRPKNCVEDSAAYYLAKRITKQERIPIKEAFTYPEVAATLVKGRSLENDFEGKGYGALNGKVTIGKYIMSKQIALSNLSQLFILSDGMLPPVKKFYGKINLQDIIEKIKKLGIEKYCKENFDLRESDPDLLVYPRFKKHDDASLLEMTFH